MGRGQKKRQLQINQTEIFPAAAAQRGAQAVERLGSPGLCVRNERRQLLTSLKLVHRLDHKGMARQSLVEGLEYLQRLFRRAVARYPAAIGLNYSQRR